MRILAVSGSLRASSGNTALLKAAQKAAPPDLEIALFTQLEAIPAFNPDREAETAPSAVAALRDSVREHDAVLISTPEYAHGIPGVLKNALDWLVGSGEFYEKPVAFLHTSPRGEIARAALKEVLVTMAAQFVFDGEAEPGDTQALRAALAEIQSGAARANAQAQNKP